MSYIAVWLVQVPLLELFHYYMTLHFQTPFVEVERKHAVTFQPEACFYILTGKGDVIVGDIVVGPRIVFASGILNVHVIVGYIYRAAEHEMFEKVRKPRVVGVLISCSHIVEHVQSNHLCIFIFGMDDAESVLERVSVYGNHSMTVAFKMRTFSTGRSARPVLAPSIFSTVSIPSNTCPNTV